MLNEMIEEKKEALFLITRKASPRQLKYCEDFEQVMENFNNLTQDLDDLKFIKNNILTLITLHIGVDKGFTGYDKEINLLEQEVYKKARALTKTKYNALKLIFEEYEEKYLERKEQYER